MKIQLYVLPLLFSCLFCKLEAMPERNLFHSGKEDAEKGEGSFQRGSENSIQDAVEGKNRGEFTAAIEETPSVEDVNKDSLNQMERSEALLSLEQQATSASSSQLDKVFEMSPLIFGVISEMCADREENRLENLCDEYKCLLNEGVEEAEQPALRDVIKVLEDAISYKKFFMQEEARISKRQGEERVKGTIQEPVAVTSIKGLLIRASALHRNIDRLILIAEEIKEQHLQLRKVTEGPGVGIELTGSLEADAIRTIIEIEKDFVQKVKERNFQGANQLRISNRYLEARIQNAADRVSLYHLSLRQARRERRGEEVDDLLLAKELAKSSIRNFKKAAESSTEAAKEGYSFSGYYYLSYARENVVRRKNPAKKEETIRFSLLAGMSEAREDSVGVQTGQELSKEGQAANQIYTSYLDEGIKAALNQNLPEAQNWRRAAWYASVAIVEFLRQKDEITPLRNLSGNYYLLAAKAEAERNHAEAKRLEQTAHLVYLLRSYDVASLPSTLDQEARMQCRKAHDQKYDYCCRLARAVSKGDERDVERLDLTANLAELAKGSFLTKAYRARLLSLAEELAEAEVPLEKLEEAATILNNGDPQLRNMMKISTLLKAEPDLRQLFLDRTAEEEGLSLSQESANTADDQSEQGEMTVLSSSIQLLKQESLSQSSLSDRVQNQPKASVPPPWRRGF